MIIELMGGQPGRGRAALLVITLAALFGWLLSFPLFGPALSWLEGRGVDTFPGVRLFLIFHAISLLAGTWLPPWRSRPERLLAASAGGCLAASLLTLAMPERWPLWAAVAGAAAALGVLAWCLIFVSTAPPLARGRLLAAAMALANGWLYLDTLLAFVWQRPAAAMLLATSCLVLLLALTAFPKYHHAAATRGPGGEAGEGVTPLQDRRPRRRWRHHQRMKMVAEVGVILIWNLRSKFLRETHLPLPTSHLYFQGRPAVRPPRATRLFPLPWPLAVFIFSFYLTSGLVADYVFHGSADFPAVATWYGVLPYIIAVGVAGFLADRSSRGFLAYLGLAAIGISLVMGGGNLPSLPGAILSHSLMQAGYAFIDLYLWVTLADLAATKYPPRYFGAGLGLNVLAITGGTFLSRLASPAEGAPVMLALVAVFVALLPLALLQERWGRPPEENGEVARRVPDPVADPGLALEHQHRGVAASLEGYVAVPLDEGEARLGPASDRAKQEADEDQESTGEDKWAGPGMPGQPAAAGNGRPTWAVNAALTPREQEVVFMLARGMSNAQIQERLYMSKGTLKTHVRHIYRKFNVNNRQELVQVLQAGTGEKGEDGGN